MPSSYAVGVTAALPNLVPEPDNYAIPLARYQDMVVRMAPKAPAVDWPAELVGVDFILEHPVDGKTVYPADIITTYPELVVKVESEVTDTWSAGWEWTIRFNWDDGAPEYNQVPANGVLTRKDGKRKAAR